MFNDLRLPLIALVFMIIGCVSETKTLSSRDIVSDPDERKSILTVKIRKYEELVSEFPEEPKHHQRLAAFYWQLGDHEKALESIANAEKLDPDNRELVYMRALIHQGSGNYRLAEDNFRELARRTPNYTGPRYDLAWLFMEQNRFKDALAEFQACLEIDPIDPLPYYYIGKLQYERFRDRQAAIKNWETYMELGGERFHNEVRQILVRLQPDLRSVPASFRPRPVIR